MSDDSFRQGAAAWIGVVLLWGLYFCGEDASAVSVAGNTGPEISFPASTRSSPVTGRLLLIFSHKREPEMRFQAGWLDSPPMFGFDVNSLAPGQAAVFDTTAVGFPYRSLNELPAGDYYVQSVLNIYTQYHRSDGHELWAHRDPREGQHFNQSPGNLYTKVQSVHWDPAHARELRLSLSEVIPDRLEALDTDQVKHLKIQSKLLTAFWGRPMYFGGRGLAAAGLLLASDTALSGDLPTGPFQPGLGL